MNWPREMIRRPLIATYERFATLGQMMPEQVWDEADRPGLEKGKPAGSAVPLVWAHAEYLKLLRSTVDGKVFDRIDSVYERYCEPRGQKAAARQPGVLQPPAADPEDHCRGHAAHPRRRAI